MMKDDKDEVMHVINVKLKLHDRCEIRGYGDDQLVMVMNLRYSMSCISLNMKIMNKMSMNLKMHDVLLNLSKECYECDEH